MAILETTDPAAKAAASRELAARWAAGAFAVGRAEPPLRPSRPERPALRPPREMPRRRNFGAPAGRLALLHALAHIELNAIDLAWDMIARFAGCVPAPQFADDWVRVAGEEALHFTLLAQRLAAIGAGYGDLPAHDGLWEAAAATAHDLLGRLAVIPLVLEARGLDVTPLMITRLDAAGDRESAGILQRIYDDEIGHVATGWRWFAHFCRESGLDPEAVFRDRISRFYRGALKPPFNRVARDRAGLPRGLYDNPVPENPS